MPLVNKFSYRPEVDGLRAIAVVAVVLYHAGGFYCHGGYVGVDVFFVISGFLITSLIWRDLETGRFTFAYFWERRARRIVPALVVVTAATLVAGWFLLLPGDYKNLGQEAAALAVFGANVYYWRNTGYFEGGADEKPLLHTWSLGVEEQFYLLVPFLLWGIFRVKALRTRAGVFSILLAGFTVSFALSIYGVIKSPSATFYLLPTRAWELLLGALVAFVPPAFALPSRPRLRELLALAGLALILVPVFAYTPETPFPGAAALSPCLGTALIIWANERTEGRIPTAVGVALSSRPIVFLGLISYSLYLWHWPLLAFSKYWTLAPLSADLGFATRVGMLSLGFLLAVLSWKYVETPLRTRRLGTSRKSAFLFAGTGLIVILSGGLICLTMQGFPKRFSELANEFANAKSDRAFLINVTPDDARAGNLVPIGVVNPALRPSVLAWGDSHAMSAIPALDACLKDKGLAGRAATHSVTAPVLNWFMVSKFGLSKDSIAFNDAVLSYVRSQQVPHVILIANWTDYAGASDGGFNSALLLTIRQLVAAGSQPWIMLSVPEHTFDVPKVLSRSVIFRTDLAPFSTKRAASDAFDKIDRTTISDIESAGGRILDPKPRFLDPGGQRYVYLADGVVLYRDHHHLTTRGAKLMLLPLFCDSLTSKQR
ncbi:MAG TPA: acyltransferase family protein [Pyrinomonadaceae bacterium]|nr:acyltransferase family protein [Pyrinomonadaceae bacterium]